MPNAGNLKPLNTLDKETAKKICQKGQKVGTEKKIAKRTIAEILDGLDSRFLKQKINSIKSNPKLSEEKKKEYIEILKDSDNVMAFELYMIAVSSTTNPQTKLKAIEDVLDRRYGKAVQNTDITTNGKDIVNLPQPIFNIKLVGNKKEDEVLE
jgi:hypothetical protein